MAASVAYGPVLGMGVFTALRKEHRKNLARRKQRKNTPEHRDCNNV